MESDLEVEVQLDGGSLFVRAAAQVEKQLGGSGGLTMQLAIEVEVQLGSGSSMEAAEVVGVERAAAEVEKATLSNLL